MPDPITGRISGHDAGVRNPDTGKLKVDGVLDDIRYELAANGSSGRVYVLNADGSETLLTDQVVRTDVLGGECVMQFTADAALTINGTALAPDKHGDVVVIRWHPGQEFMRPDPWVQTYFFKGSASFDAIIASHDHLKSTYAQVQSNIRDNPAYGEISGCGDCQDFDGDGVFDPYDYDFLGGSAFVPISPEEPFGSTSTGNDRGFVARVGIRLSANN